MRRRPKEKASLAHPSSRRKPGSISGLLDTGTEQRDAAKWIPAFAGMTIDGSWRYCRRRHRPVTLPRKGGGNYWWPHSAPSPSTQGNCICASPPSFAMAGLDPAIHVFARGYISVDDRDKPGHDDKVGNAADLPMRSSPCPLTGEGWGGGDARYLPEKPRG